ncbi:hypothetical protein RJ639_026454 [Escallonia herrerae]|uniref:Kinesin motor domain-containing protein n=1 Tax=Escallonia herrerae TaxID=1293975 RepID=A0AA89AC97_9ASTE|nr:hypothetical protein RJ639_026454 [Escallonia herrerae]
MPKSGVLEQKMAKLVEAVLQGRNGSVFFYGAIGAGKTYTMLGTMENPGLMAGLKAFEAAIETMKKDHALQRKQEKFIDELSCKVQKQQQLWEDKGSDSTLRPPLSGSGRLFFAFAFAFTVATANSDLHEVYNIIS